MKIIKNIVQVLLTMMMIIVFLLTVLKFAGYYPYCVLSSSMEPTLQIGDLILVKDEKTKNLKVGDIVTYYGQQNQIVTHRIVEVQETEYITKGDHNKDVDITSLHNQQIIGKVIVAIPYLGYLISGLSRYVILGIIIIVIWYFSYKKKE